MRGFESTVDSRLNFGLGKTEKIDSVVVVWNDGREQVIKDAKPNQTIMVKQREAVSREKSVVSSESHFPLATSHSLIKQLRK